jgi:Ion channel
MTTVGYGDISPTNIYEAAILIVGMVSASFTFAVTFNTIGSIVEDLNKERNLLQNQLSLVNVYLHNKHVSQELKFKIQKYFEYKHQSEKELTNEEEE